MIPKVGRCGLLRNPPTNRNRSNSAGEARAVPGLDPFPAAFAIAGANQAKGSGRGDGRFARTVFQVIRTLKRRGRNSTVLKKSKRNSIMISMGSISPSGSRQPFRLSVTFAITRKQGDPLKIQINFCSEWRAHERSGSDFSSDLLPARLLLR